MSDENENLPITTEDSNEIAPQQESETVDAPHDSNEPEKSNEDNELTLLGEQFENYMRIAKALMKTLKRPKDIDICNDLLKKVQTLHNSRHLEVLRNNNRFFRYCLRVLKWTSENQPMELYRTLYPDDTNSCNELKEVTQWSSDKKSYMAAKTYKNGVSLIYMAVLNDVEAGWQEDGFKILQQKMSCERE